MNKRMRLKLAALGLGTALLIGAAGCDLGNPTPTPVVPTATSETTQVVEETPTAVAPTPTAIVETPAAEATPTQESGGVVPGETPRDAVTPVPRQTGRFAEYNVQATSVNPVLKPY